ncbi:xanthine dehydrogenase family protein molybdopterin-binding subunit [Chromobacterium violaceum]|uniref:xanthine dehydrogenase family protein molybdopterin-binding subunit n=1 Tax=Chromobacterium violaceum TaxID=536 RepID=UPI0009DACE54|nr:xanthine dehydrogenase family protein molybdopterin-binding subunit [Chromobacterium violaceum]MBP4050251.1 xanthine dehydrogenase family protein molybdopterin-binding subunit [Chromobacterium violaceum]OQS27996.1 twin-arginine translocation pathway signal protein [Chromobacterium violaceum]
MTTTGVSRRGFLKMSGAVGGALCLGFVLNERGGKAEAAEAKSAIPAPNAFVRIERDGGVTIVSNKSEMGQGIYTSLAMLIAEELECDWNRIKVVSAPAAPVYVHTAFHIQITGGSTSTLSSYDQYRKIGAAARDMLILAAAQRWRVPASQCRAENSRVFNNANGASLGYGELTEAAGKLPVPDTVELKPRHRWKLLGTRVHRVDGDEKLDGRAQFAMDVRLPGMLTALVKRCPSYGGKPKGFNADAARAVPGVRDVFAISNGVAVLADGFWPAKKARDLLTVDWDHGPNAGLDSAKLRADYRARAATPGQTYRSEGDAEAALAGAAKKLEAWYEVPYLSHSPMEPLNCVVWLRPGSCEIWSGTQSQTLDAGMAAAMAGLKPEQVSLHTTLLGGGFGRRAVPAGADWLKEAMEVAKRHGQGAPIRLMWTRDDDLAGAYYRPMWLDRVRGGIDAAGRPAAWLQTGVGQSIIVGTPFAPMMIKNGIDAVSVEGTDDMPYALPAVALDLHTAQTPLPVLWWRSVGHSHSAFTKESYIDELARLARQDPVAYRLALLGKAPREQGVLREAARMAGWGRKLPKGHGLGAAVHSSFGSHVAQVVEVSLKGKALKVEHVWCAIDCGVVVNPDQVAAQMEGGILFGLSAALFGEITFKDGEVEQKNFDGYPIVRMFQAPKVDVSIVASEEAPGGTGEPAVPVVAPALANAIHAASGKRLRELPLSRHGYQAV